MKKEDTHVKVEAGIASFYTAKIRQGLIGIHSFVKNHDRFRGIFLLFFLCTFLIQPQVYGQSGLCDPTVPFFQVDLTGQPNGTYISPLVVRNDNCCGTTHPDRCLEFEITLDPGTIAINFTIASGAVPPGSMFYQINCGPQVAVGTPVCLSGPGPHTLTFCKPGNNPNTYGIFAIPGPSVSGEDLASPVCPARLIASGFTESTLVWHDITSGTGAYDAYLSQTTGNDTVYVTPGAGFPPYVDYQVCGAPIVPDCYNTADFCDTLRVYFYQNVSAIINPNPAGFCSGEAGVTLTGLINDGIGPYTFEWHNAANGGGSIVNTTSLTYFATAGGTYSLVVYDSTYPHCPPAVTNVIVTEYPNPILSIEPLNPMICIGTPLNLTASGADNYLWSPATGLSGTTGATVTAMPPVTTTYTIIGWNNGPLACADTIYTTFTVLPLTEVSAGPDDTICFGGSTQLNASGGDIYVWTPATGLSNPNIADPIASPAVTTTYIVSSASFDGQVIGNGDFTQGNTGFSSDYSYQFNLWPEGYYYVGTNPNSNHPNWSPCGDHTTGTGNMMIVNGAPIANQEVWCKTVDITPNTDYAFSTWLASVHPDNPAVLQFSINGILLGSPFNASGTTCQWQQFYAIWNSGSNTTAQICIVNQNIIRNGNDFALDDIFFTPICEDLDTVTVFVSNITHTITGTDVNCFGGNNGTASVSVSGGFEPYSYQWSNGATTPTLSGLSAGTYCVTVTDASACTETACITINQPTLLTSVINLSTNVSCFGGNNGAATVTASGGTVPYSYLWSNGANTAAISGLSAGTYNVTVTDAFGCTATTSIIITEPTLLTSGISASTNVSCFGGNNGAATVTANGGTTPYSYLWSNSANTAAISGLTAGAYNVTVTDALGCTATASVIITEPTLLTSAISASTNVSCFGGNNGAATVTANGGTTPYAYLWSNGATTAAVSGLTAGNYLVTVTDVLGCTATSSVIITEPTLLTSVISASANVSCFGGNNGAATVTASGGTAPYSYLWSNGANTAAISGLTAGAYNVTVTDALGCTATSSVIITEPTLLTSVISASANVSCFGGNNGAATVTASGGTTPYSYLWSNGANTAAISGLTAGTYNVTVTDALGCTSSASVIITEPTLLTSGISASTNVSCFGGNNGAATVSASGGTTPYSYLWSNGANTATISGLTAGTYNVIITDALGCTSATSVIITEPTLLTSAISASTNVSCFGGNNGAATVTANGGTTPYSYLWSNSANTASISGLTAGTYTITVTDALGCTASASVSITHPPLLTAGISIFTNVSCFGGNNGTATVTANGGTAPYSYLWSNGANTAAISGLSAGTYNVTITDALGCTAAASVIITEPTLLTSAISSSANVSCFGGNNGAATVTANGGTTPYSYLWSNGANTASISGLTAGAYNVTVTDALGCTATASVIITEPTLLTSAISASTNVSCFGGNNGAATVTANGGTAPYLYLWSNGATNAAISGLTAGTYNVTITDGLGCTATSNVIITEPTLLTAVISSSTNVSCFGGNNGSATVTANGGTTPYSYLWSNGANTAAISGLTAGSYNVTITDGLGCTASASVIITEPTLLTSAISASSNVSCFGGNNGAATVTANGGTTPYSYLWSNGANTAAISGLTAGTYNVTITDALGCTSSSSVIITEPTLLTSVISASANVSCFGGNNGAATVSANGGTTPYSYLWSNGANTASISELTAGNYQVTVTDALGCTASTSVIITEPTLLTSAISASTNVSCFGGNNGSATITANGGTLPYSYLWSNNANTATITGLVAGVYNVTITDALGCTSTSTNIITEPPLLTIAIFATTDVSCNGGHNGAITSTTSGGTPSYQYLWSNSQTSDNIDGLTAGTYTVTVTDHLGCTAATSALILEPPVLVSTITSSSDVACFGGNNGSATVTTNGGTPAYTYAWSNGSNTPGISGLVAGTYQVTVTDNNNCQNIESVSIFQPTPLTAGISNSTNIACYGGNTGSATASGSGGTLPYQYLWSNGVQSAINGGLTAGAYNVIITDQNGCTATAGVVLTQPDIINLNLHTTNVICFGGNSGTATVNAVGGVSPYEYLWTPTGATTQSISNLNAATYTSLVTDANGCTASASAIVAQPPQLYAQAINISPVSCYGGTNGSATIDVHGGIAPYTYLWVGPGYNTPTVNTLNAGMYSVIVTDANFCNYTVNFNITQPAPVTIGVTGTTTICQGSTATLTVVGSGGTAPYTFTWDNGMDNGATQLVSPQTTTDYHVTVTDALGCTSAPGVITVTVFPGLQVILNAPNLVCEGSTVVLSAIGTGGNGGPYTFSWNNGITASTASVSVHPELGTTVYIVGIADGCGTPMVWDTLALTATPNPSPHILADNLSSCTPYTVNFQETTQPPYASYLWTFGDMYAGSANTSTEANPSHYYSQPGIYTVGLTVVDSVGCSAIISYPDFINIYGNPTAAFTWHPETVTIADPHVEFNNESIGGYSYNWDFGDPDSGPSNVSTIEHPSHDFTHVGTYDVWLVIESKYGCKDSTMNEITILDVYTFYAPNAFTPNDDGVNDYFIPQSTNLDYATFDFFVIDRWGEIIYETHDPNAPWDGRAKSSKKIVQQDVYTWVVYVNEVSGKRHQYIGHVTVVR